MARRVRVEVDHRDTLEKALSGMAIHPTGGPLSGQARKQLAAHTTAVERVLADFDRLRYDMAKRAAPLVLSHGEPHPGNVLACDGGLLLLDWDTVGLAPPERDLWWLSSSDAVGAMVHDSAASEAVDAIAHYSVASGSRVDPGALRLYRLRWLLDDLVYCVRMLWSRRPGCWPRVSTRPGSAHTHKRWIARRASPAIGQPPAE
jgi:spectinomycin phosphotransferase